MKNKGIAISILITVFLISLMAWGNKASRDNSSPEQTVFGDTEILCLTSGHQNLADHTHPELKITVNGVPEVIPENIGITANCMSEIHTHDTTGVIHAESYLPGRVSGFTLGDFFTVWEVSPERAGFTLEIKQDGEIKNSVTDVKMIDKSIIELNYTS